MEDWKTMNIYKLCRGKLFIHCPFINIVLLKFKLDFVLNELF